MSYSDTELLKRAEQAALQAYAPYSHFKVGASVLLENKEIITGNNQENIAYPSGLCAERVALFYAKSQYPDNSVLAMAVTYVAQENKEVITPCGSCRQVMSEYELNQQIPIRILLSNGIEENSEVLILDSCSSLLPLSFYNKSLKK